MKVTIDFVRVKKGEPTLYEATVHFPRGLFGTPKPRQAFSTSSGQFWNWLDTGESIFERKCRDLLEGAAEVEQYRRRKDTP
jgi:hypothetical protein